VRVAQPIPPLMVIEDNLAHLRRQS
jgi:hypothetical protein